MIIFFTQRNHAGAMGCSPHSAPSPTVLNWRVKIILGLLLVLSPASLAQARLGETPDQVVARFGTCIHSSIIPSGHDAGLNLEEFDTQGFTITVLFKVVSVDETYQADGKLTENQIQALLVANSEGHQWKESPNNREGRFWTRDDEATARLIDTGFEFKSKFLVDKEASFRKAQHPNVEGF